MNWKRWWSGGLLGLLIVGGPFPAGARALELVAMKEALTTVGWELHRAILADEIEAIVALLPREEAFQKGEEFTGDYVRLYDRSGDCEDCDDTVSSNVIIRSLRRRRGEAYARLFDTVRYRRLHRGERVVTATSMSPECLESELRGEGFQSVKDYFLQAGERLWLWVEVGGRDWYAPYGIVHYEWPGRKCTAFAIPRFNYEEGRWWLTDFFTASDVDPNDIISLWNRFKDPPR